MSGRHELRRLLANPALIIGLIGTLALLGMGVWGAVIAPYDPNANLSMVIKHLPDGTISFKVPPTFPDSDHVFGTDALGRDQWSRLLTGAWLSLSIVVAAAVLRLGIGFSLGITSGWYGGPFARLVRIVAAGITAVPQLLLAIMLVLVTRPLGVAGFIASLALVGWPEITEYLRAEVLRAKAQPFMEAARSTGVPGRRLITTHLAATVGPQLLTVAALETGAVLLLLAELGLVGLFLAGATFLVGDFGPVGPLKGLVPEWGQMLGGLQFYAITAELPTLIPAMFVVLASATFALLADGLRAASDPFSSRRVLPGTFGVVSKVLVGALCFSAVGFISVNVRPGAISMEEGRSLAAKTAETTWPGSEFVAGVARYSSGARDDRPERLTYYFRSDRNEVLRISFIKADRLAVEVRRYESEDEIDFTLLKALPANLLSYDGPLRQAEQNGGFVYRQRQPNYLVRVILTWPNDREAPVYEVTYNPLTGPQGNPLRVCCFDAKTGEAVDSLVAPRVAAPWPIPPDCTAARTVFRQLDRFQGYFVQGGTLSVGSPFNLNYQGDNFIQMIGGQGTPRLEAAANMENASARAELVNAQPNASVAGQSLSFATLRLPVPGCWKVRITVGTAALDYTLYAYPWDCRPQHERFAPVPGVTPLPCTKT